MMLPLLAIARLGLFMCATLAQQPQDGYPIPLYRNDDPALNPGAYNGRNYQGVILSPTLKVMIRRHGLTRADIVVSSGPRQYSGADIAIVHPYASRKPVRRYGPGQVTQAYVFHFSPEKRFLFVIRDFDVQFTVGYLYRMGNDGRLTLVRPHGLRFDEAAVRYLIESKGAPPGRATRMRRGERTVEFVGEFLGWSADGKRLMMRIYTSSGWEERRSTARESAFGYVSYDVVTGAFRNYTRDVERELDRRARAESRRQRKSPPGSPSSAAPAREQDGH